VDLGFIIGDEDKKQELCMIQISINKTIKKIQVMLKNFENKSKFIISKIKEIFGININSINLLFILSKKYQNEETFNFMNLYKIPFIYFNYYDDTFHFLNKKYEEITYFKHLKLGINHQYIKNKTNFEESLNYKSFNDIKDEEEYGKMEEEEEDDISEEKIMEISDILSNEFTDGIIN